ncbi:MAG: M20 family metallo-hydrolase [Emergencia sp.]|nr:M20 family metallo-hydrolase [Emergencia sp.]
MEREIQWIKSAVEELAVTAERNGEYWRATYTAEDAKGTALIEKWLMEKGFQVRYDEVGNLYGRVEGESAEVVLIGSHRDTVKNGGKYDGALGIITAIEAVAALCKIKGRPEKTLEVVALCEEEASRFLTGYVGSRAIIGELREEHLGETDADGITLETAMRNGGYYQGKLPKKREDLHSFLELHIEQGGVLEKNQKKVGIVASIVGLYTGELLFYGEQNHAGTTPMSMRKDPVPLAAEFINRLNKWAGSKDDQVTCTFGNLLVKPGKSNVIADMVRLTFDIRSGRKELLREAQEQINAFLLGHQNFKTEVKFACKEDPVNMDETGIELLESLAQKLNLKALRMSSGAGHDAQIIASETRTNMIFVPSQGGVSHSPQEYTSEEDICQGYMLMRAYLETIAW